MNKSYAVYSPSSIKNFNEMQKLTIVNIPIIIINLIESLVKFSSSSSEFNIFAIKSPLTVSKPVLNTIPLASEFPIFLEWIILLPANPIYSSISWWFVLNIFSVGSIASLITGRLSPVNCDSFKMISPLINMVSHGNSSPSDGISKTSPGTNSVELISVFSGISLFSFLL